jgi:hypothetical protein
MTTTPLSLDHAGEIVTVLSDAFYDYSVTQSAGPSVTSRVRSLGGINVGTVLGTDRRGGTQENAMRRKCDG